MPRSSMPTWAFTAGSTPRLLGARLHAFDRVDVAIAYAVFTMGVGMADARAYLQRVADDFGIGGVQAADLLIDILEHPTQRVAPGPPTGCRARTTHRPGPATCCG